jgi:hypothetical protein
VDCGDRFLYGIPSDARRVVKFDPLDKSLTEIGPDFGEGILKWMCGVRVNTGSIYCAPFNNIYYMPLNARRILRLNPDNDSLSSVGGDLEGRRWWKYKETVVGNDDCVYGIPYAATRIVKYNPVDPYTTSTVREEAEEGFYCGNGVLVGDGDIYAVNGAGQVLQIDTPRNTTPGLCIEESIQEDFFGGVTLLLELISAYVGHQLLPCAYSNLIPRHKNYHRSWEMTWVRKEVSNGWVELCNGWGYLLCPILFHSSPCH